MKRERLHVGNCTVYLTDGWTNIDLYGSGSRLASACPEGVAKWGTTEAEYYGRMTDQRKQLVISGECPDHELTVCDRYGSWFDLPCDNGCASEILSRQVWEHLSITEARRAMREANRVLCEGGLLRLDVPDIEATLELYRETGDLFLKRHILGSLKNDFSYHCVGWTRDGLRAFVEQYGFRFVEWEDPPKKRFYPSICGKWVRL